MRVIGIDPGLDGGLVVLVEGLVAHGRSMPTVKMGTGGKREIDTAELYDWLWWSCVNSGDSKVEVYLERQQSMPRDGKASAFKTGMGYGLIRGMLTGMGIPYKIVDAKKWQRAIFADILGPDRETSDTKTMSVMAAQRMWPTVDFRDGPRCRVAHHGITDAACIAEFARRVMLVSAVSRNDRERSGHQSGGQTPHH